MRKECCVFLFVVIVVFCFEAFQIRSAYLKKCRGTRLGGVLNPDEATAGVSVDSSVDPVGNTAFGVGGVPVCVCFGGDGVRGGGDGCIGVDGVGGGGGGGDGVRDGGDGCIGGGDGVRGGRLNVTRPLFDFRLSDAVV